MPLVSSSNPCLCASRLPALSIYGASQNVQIARRPSVCRGNRLPVALFPGKSAHFTPISLASNSIFTDKRGKWLISVSDATCCSIWGVAFWQRATFFRFPFFSPPPFLKLQIDAWAGERSCILILWLLNTDTQFNTSLGVDAFAVLISTRRSGLCIDALFISVHFPPPCYASSTPVQGNQHTPVALWDFRAGFYWCKCAGRDSGLTCSLNLKGFLLSLRELSALIKPPCEAVKGSPEICVILAVTACFGAKQLFCT